jgi:hypothetical protein
MTATSRNKPSYSQTVRNGLLLIALRHTPTTDEERRAIAWIRDMNAWHIQVVQPAERRVNKSRKTRTTKEAA